MISPFFFYVQIHFWVPPGEHPMSQVALCPLPAWGKAGAAAGEQEEGCRYHSCLVPSSCGGLGLRNKVWGCALPAGSAREGEGIPCSLIQIFNAGAAAWLRLSTGAAASRRRAVFHLFPEPGWYLQHRYLITDGLRREFCLGFSRKIGSVSVGAVPGISAEPWKG